MKVPFNQLPDSSKVWIYQASRKLTKDEAAFILSAAETFVDSWTAHQAGLKAGASVVYNHFVIIAVDESFNNASGCSIDKQVHFVQSLGEKLNVDFFNRMNVVLKINDTDHLITSVNNIDLLLENKTITKDTFTYNNLVDNLHDFKTAWEVKVSDSWVVNFISNN